MSGVPWFLRLEAVWNSDWRQVAGALRDAQRHVGAHPLSFGGFVLAWLVPLLPWTAWLPVSFFLQSGESRTSLALVVWAHSFCALAVEAAICLFLFRQYVLAVRGGGEALFAKGLRRWGRSLPFFLGAYAVHWGAGMALALSLPLFSAPEAGLSWAVMTLKWQLVEFFARLPVFWIVCRFGGAPGAVAAGDDPAMRRAWGMTAGRTRVLLYTCLLWFLVQRTLPGFAVFPLYELAGRALSVPVDWLFWFRQLYAAAVWAFFTLVGAAWYERLRPSEPGAESPRA
ncbi:hypothetical protein [Desulfovibrio sp. Huiquan2017]|uniref:hypothetical protein n=1 Tax=Desulfovibrio sp. Huiquan2017 TaxID=2816861 RepID=UPI001A938950|nr:hypothetical protein [Desulfovibrio sp. Huiquan2017]